MSSLYLLLISLVLGKIASTTWSVSYRSEASRNIFVGYRNLKADLAFYQPRKYNDLLTSSHELQIYPGRHHRLSTIPKIIRPKLRKRLGKYHIA